MENQQRASLIKSKSNDDANKILYKKVSMSGFYQDKSSDFVLIKQFSIILRNRSKDIKYPKLTPSLVNYYTRKELIEIIKKKHDNAIPKEYNLVEMENQELLKLIGDDMNLISFSTSQWAIDEETIKIVTPPSTEKGTDDTDTTVVASIQNQEKDKKQKVIANVKSSKSDKGKS